jgi:hypothetical protein
MQWLPEGWDVLHQKCGKKANEYITEDIILYTIYIIYYIYAMYKALIFAKNVFKHQATSRDSR